MRWPSLLIACLTGLLLSLPGMTAFAQERKTAGGDVDYNRDIRPIFSNRCYACHGPHEHKRKAGLRFDRRENALQELDSGGHAIVPGKPSESKLIQRITAATESQRMPPTKTGPRLSQNEIALLRRWIEQGAPWQQHWAYIPPERPPLPAVENTAWPRNGIDYFILARLEKEGLQPTPEADRTTLIRRLSFDLTGLPPTPAEVDAFVTDQSPNAYEKVVDRLLASPRYGERMAQQWLDLARYADTNGYHIDNHRDMWKWREWVINAFNRNMPFDQFTIEQLAGDMLPTATREQRIASGFNRNGMVNFEGGADPDEYQTQYVIDRVNTTATVWLGTTIACTQCHDHKYDPFTQREFYRLYAFFNNVPEKGLDGQKENPVPSLKLLTAEQEVKLAALRRQQADLDARIQQALAKIKLDEPMSPGGTGVIGVVTALAQPQAVARAGTAIVAVAQRREATAGTAVAQPQEAREYVWVEDALPPGAVPQGNEGPASWKWVSKPSPVFSGAKAHTRTAQGLSQHFFTGASRPLRIGPGDKLFAHVYLDPRNPPQTIMLQFNDGSWEHRAYWGANRIEWGADKTPSRQPMGPLPETGKWMRLEVDPQAVGLGPGSAVNGVAFTQFDGTVYWDKAGLVTRTPQESPKDFDSVAAWEEFERANRAGKLPKNIKDLINLDPPKRTEQQKQELKNYFVQHVYAKTRAVFAPLNKEQEQLRKAEAELNRAIPSTMVMEEMPKPRDTFMLVRGDWQHKGEKVTPGVPAVLPPLPPGVKADRLGLARWLVMPTHPLTPRVTVNRYWQMYFGAGIVKTSQDFGSQAEWPSHPELLDWLATEFIGPSRQPSFPGGEDKVERGWRGRETTPQREDKVKGWDIKAFQKLLVMSATYRQSSKVTPELLRRDPGNRLLARGPRFRLDAEMIRDNALAVSGLLDERLGGPSVRPYQPAGLWKAVSFGGGYSAQTYEQSKGKELYRRGIYTYWKRSLPHPSMVNFDAPSREVCTDRRPRTNTPLQALELLNDPIYVECARVLGQRALKEGGKDTAAQLTYAFRLCTGRQSTAAELKILQRLFDQQLARFKKEPQAAQKLITVGESPRPPKVDPSELATWTAICNIFLNLDETITKG